MFLATYWKISFKIWRFGNFFIKIKWRTHRIEGSVTFYGLTIQEETRRDNSHQWIWAICSINSLVQDEIGSIFQVTIWQKFVAGRIPGDTYLWQGIRETKLIHDSFKRQLLLWDEMPTYIPLRYYHNNSEYNIFATFI